MTENRSAKSAVSAAPSSSCGIRPTAKICSQSPATRSFTSSTPKGIADRKLQGHNDWVYALAVSPDSKTVASGSWDGEVKLWNLADGKLLKTIIAAPGFKAGGAQTAAK